MTVVDVLLFAHLASTLYMTGLIWFVQVVHYPLFRQLPAADFRALALEHQRRTSLVVVAPMLLEAATAVALVVAFATDPASLFPASLGLALLAAIWASTFLLQVPCHRRLTRGRDEPAIERLITTNWIRTVGWTLRAGVALFLLVG